MFLVFLSIDGLVRRSFLKPAFAALEHNHAHRDASRVLAAIESEREHLDELAVGLSHRMPTDRGIQQPDRWVSDHIDYAAVFDTETGWQPLRIPKRPDAPEPAGPSADLSELERLLRDDAAGKTSGMIRDAAGNLLMFARAKSPDGTANRSADPSGPEAASKLAKDSVVPRHLVIARRMDHRFIQDLCHRTQVSFSLQEPSTPPLGRPTSAASPSIRSPDESTLVVEVPLRDHAENVVAIIFMRVPRDVTRHAFEAIRSGRNRFIFGSVAALLLLLLLLQRLVIMPIHAIRDHTIRVAEQGFAVSPLELNRDDEIGDLSTAFDAMIGKLHQSQIRVSDASRAAGMSQVAGTVIHNVGNVLTNVNSLVDSICGKTKGLRVTPLHRLAARIRTDSEDQEFANAMPTYLDALAASLQSDQQQLLDLLTTLQSNICHIEEVMRYQRKHTRAGNHRSTFSIADVVDEAIGCCRARLERDNVDVRVGGTLQTSIRSDKGTVLQVLINLIANAHAAFAGVESRIRKIDIDVDNDGESVCIRVRDNASGMSKEVRQKIFDAHFTTRETGTGLGLHFCTLSISRLGGRISVHSDGVDKGSEFVIRLPMRRSTAASIEAGGPESMLQPESDLPATPADRFAESFPGGDKS